MKTATIIAALALAALLPAAGCNKDIPRPDAPRPRIVSYAPAITQILFDMGLGEHVVGVTGYCELPAGQDRQRLGDLVDINPEAIVAAKPDIVLIQMAPALIKGVRQMAPEIRIEHFSIETFPEIAAAIERIGGLVGADELGRQKRQQFEQQLEAVRQRVAGRPRPRVMLLHGTDRPGTAGRGTFIDDMIAAAGGTNAAADYKGWVDLDLELVMVAAPEVIVCQARPDQADTVRAYWMRFKSLPAVRAGRVHVITDRGLTIPSTKSPEFVASVAELIHPGSGRDEGQP